MEEFAVRLKQPKLYCATFTVWQMHSILCSCQENITPAIHNFIRFRAEANFIMYILLRFLESFYNLNAYIHCSQTPIFSYWFGKKGLLCIYCLSLGLNYMLSNLRRCRVIPYMALVLLPNKKYLYFDQACCVWGIELDVGCTIIICQIKFDRNI
jgi:hypothetical protein